MPNNDHSVAAVLILGAYALFFVIRHIERHGLFRGFRRLSPWRKVGVIVVLLYATMTGATKAPPVMQQLFRLLFWSPQSQWALAPTAGRTDAAAEAVEEAERGADDLEATATNEVNYISFDWHAPDRQPYHARQNVLAWTCEVRPIEVGGQLHEDHFIEFSAGVSTNPAVIEIEYAMTQKDGQVYRELANVVTSSYPHTEVVNLQSGAHTCYWFRCRVPQFAATAVRDWSGEALFGSSTGGAGFDLVGILQVDDNGQVYVGESGTYMLGGTQCVYTNGIMVEAAQ